MGHIKVSEYKESLRHIDLLKRAVTETQEKIKVILNILNEMGEDLGNAIASDNIPD